MIKSVLIGSFEYDIEESDKMVDNGSIDTEKLKIHIDSTIDEQVKRQTLWHEIIHALMHQFGLSLSDHDEKMIDNLAHGICQVIRDNPKIGKSIGHE
jgi:Zn-dependent peptidase ImmA (M78 family)